MRLRERKSLDAAEGDMTPMIDMTFQLIAFFMVLINFTDADQNARIRLPSSELAKPADSPLETPITLQLTSKGTVLIAAEEVPVEGLKPLLLRERQILDAIPGKSAGKATIVIRADREAKTGLVQKVIKACQESGFERFALRAKQQVRDT